MKTFRTLTTCALLVALANCQKPADPAAATCQPPTTLAAQSSCQSGYSGTLLIASGYQINSMTQFEYHIYPQPDTVSSDVSIRTNKWANASNERILVPDTVLRNVPKFLVRVTINCGMGQVLQAPVFAFVKRPGTTSGCYVWALQKL